MAQLLVRRVGDDVVDALKKRAEAHGRSVEEEHRRILRRVLFPKKARLTLAEHILAFPQLDEKYDDDDPFARNPDRKPASPRLA